MVSRSAVTRACCSWESCRLMLTLDEVARGAGWAQTKRWMTVAQTRCWRRSFASCAGVRTEWRLSGLWRPHRLPSGEYRCLEHGVYRPGVYLHRVCSHAGDWLDCQ